MVCSRRSPSGRYYPPRLSRPCNPPLCLGRRLSLYCPLGDWSEGNAIVACEADCGVFVHQESRSRLLHDLYLPRATRYSLLATRYSLLTTGYSLLATCYSLLATRHSLLATRYSLLATRHSPLATRYSLLLTHYPLRMTAYYSLLAVPGVPRHAG